MDQPGEGLIKNTRLVAVDFARGATEPGGSVAASTYHLDMRQSVKKKDRYPEHPHQIMASIVSVRRSLSSHGVLPYAKGPSDVAKAWSLRRKRMASGKPRYIDGRMESSRRPNSMGCHHLETPRTAATRGWRKVGWATGSVSCWVAAAASSLMVVLTCVLMVFCSAVMLVAVAVDDCRHAVVASCCPSRLFADHVLALDTADICPAGSRSVPGSLRSPLSPAAFVDVSSGSACPCHCICRVFPDVPAPRVYIAAEYIRLLVMCVVVCYWVEGRSCDCSSMRGTARLEL